MSRASRARRIAAKAAYGGGTLGVMGAAFYGLLRGEARLARRTVGEPDGAAPPADGFYGYDGGEPIVFAILGDSSAAGLGVHEPYETPGALLAGGLAEVAGRPVRLINVAVVGACTEDVHDQVAQVLEYEPAIAVVMVGANDVTHRVRPAVSIRHLDQIVRRLRAAGAEVVAGTCPDLGTIEPIAQPLRWVARRLSRNLAAAQSIAVVEAGGRSVSLGDLLGPEFAAAPAEMFSADHFHPSATGYASAAAALLPSVCAALGYWPEGEIEPQPSAARGEGVRSLAQAAAQASEEPGTEVAPTQVQGQDRGPRGRWVTLRHRIRRFTRRPVRSTPDAAPAEPVPPTV